MAIHKIIVVWSNTVKVTVLSVSLLIFSTLWFSSAIGLYSIHFETGRKMVTLAESANKASKESCLTLTYFVLNFDFLLLLYLIVMYQGYIYQFLWFISRNCKLNNIFHSLLVHIINCIFVILKQIDTCLFLFIKDMHRNNKSMYKMTNLELWVISILISHPVYTVITIGCFGQGGLMLVNIIHASQSNLVDQH